MHSQRVSHLVPPVDVGGAAGEVPAVGLQRILYTKVSSGKDLVWELYLGVAERQLLVLTTLSSKNTTRMIELTSRSSQLSAWGCLQCDRPERWGC